MSLRDYPNHTRPHWAMRVPTTLHEVRRFCVAMIMPGGEMIDCLVEPDYHGMTSIDDPVRGVYVWAEWSVVARGWRHIFRGADENGDLS